MSDWVDIAAIEDFPAGAVRSVEVDGVQIAVFNVDGTCYADLPGGRGIFAAYRRTMHGLRANCRPII